MRITIEIPDYVATILEPFSEAERQRLVTEWILRGFEMWRHQEAVQNER